MRLVALSLCGMIFYSCSLFAAGDPSACPEEPDASRHHRRPSFSMKRPPKPAPSERSERTDITDTDLKALADAVTACMGSQQRTSNQDPLSSKPSSPVLEPPSEKDSAQPSRPTLRRVSWQRFLPALPEQEEEN